MNNSLITRTVFASCLLATGVCAQEAAKKPHVPLEKSIGVVTPSAPVPSLAVINSTGAKIENGKLLLTGVSPTAIVFADRPVRAAGHVTTKQFIMQWDEGKDNFAIDPPNATVSVLGGEGADVSDVVVTLKTPKLDGANLTFDVVVLEGSLKSSGPAAVFIDAFAFRGPAGVAHVGGFGAARVGGAYWHAPVYHGAWYAGGAGVAGVAVGAAVGAAAARSYYAPPACGYYPYPPCY